MEYRIADLKDENPKRGSRNYNLTLIIAALLDLQFEIRNSILAIVDPRLAVPHFINSLNFSVVRSASRRMLFRTLG